MDGDIAPLDEIVVLAKKYDAQIFLDESHATGVLGKTGRGTPEYHGVEG
jgi:7-keto-8-aminopelargonate synthetase-like enzyme